MEDQYLAIGTKYSDVKLKPSVAYTEVSTVTNMLGDVKGRQVLDLACGTGFYTRLIHSKGAERVLGVDLSPSMIDVARTHEANHPLGIEYKVADVKSMGSVGTYDVVTAVWLLNYARTEVELLAMAKNIAKNLSVGGKLIAIIPVMKPNDGVPDVCMDFMGNQEFSIHYSQWPFESYVNALRIAGFTSVEPYLVGISSEGVEKMGLEYWNSFRNNPISLGLIAST
jgi:ubiquinone/menaquinone biosynthesis C-methylase UbiE